ncbi:Rhodanese-related sulfurtransferase [hydrothermal vent metagenome]|uniref:Rhodanese-related sulfurtransferase n=1 Tax=hydrothermal vent metagenome TaxID=652676 RepID=A0A3B0TLA4_9ZZZZ
MIISSDLLVEYAQKQIETLLIDEALALYGQENVLFVDIRDIRELKREGTIAGALHAPRGMLEFWIDPKGKYHRKEFSSGRRFVFFCAAGWRSALATKTAQDMGLEPVCHIGGGFDAWKEAGGAVDLPMNRP